MSLYVASVHTPGFLAIARPRMFRTACEAWAYLADQRRKAQEAISDYVAYSGDTLRHLEHLARDGGEGAVFSITPGRRPETDLGLVYEVQSI